jgi:predicted ATP-grasp superfamily ATP-dependent carboligase
MAEQTTRPAPWLIAAWPGMGNVAVIAAGYLIRQLQMTEVGDLAPRDHFDITEVQVKDGVIVPPRLPRGVFFRWDNPQQGRNLFVFLGEAQPANASFGYCRELISSAAGMGVERVVTFASMASGLHPAENPKVSGIATDSAVLEELRRAEVTPLSEGQIGGLNGVALAAAAERGIGGLCLLAEIPFFAAAVPNPKAARAALSVFSVLAGIDVSLEELGQHAAAMDRALIEALERMQSESEEEGESSADEPESPTPQPPSEEGPGEATREPQLDPSARARIERLFADASRDASKAMTLKQELDRLGVFKRYEDRFLDLFRRGG